MKKFYFILAASAAILAAVSCAKEDKPFEQKTASQVKLTTITLKASHETDEVEAPATALQAPVSRTELNTSTGAVTWAVGDKIKMVWNGDSSISNPLASGGSSATFTVEVGAGTKYAVYPSSVDASYDGSTFSVTVPATQDGTFENAAIEVAQHPGGQDLAFKNLGGLLQLEVASASVKKIRISSNNSTPLAGTAEVTFTNDLPVIGTITSPSTIITLNVSGAGTYYAAVLPASLNAGIYIELFDNGDNLIGEKLTGNVLNVARRQIRKLGTIAATTISNKKFFKVGGAGDGSSWDSPLGVAGLSTVLTGDSDATLFLAQGIYTLTAEIWPTAHSYKIYGGYPADATGTSLSGRDFSVETALSGGDDVVDADGNCRILVLATSGINLVADGITFKNAYKNSNDVGSALILNTLASASFNNCIIKNNVKEGSGGGGAVRIATGNSVTFTNCLFENNTCVANGGAVSISAGSHTFDKCSFVGNSSTEQNGGAMITQGSSTVNLSECEFINNKATASGKRGGAIFGLSGAYVLHLNKCYFGTNLAGGAGDDANSGNETKNGGGAIWADSSTGTLFLNACSFYGNKTATYASAIGSRGICGINNCAIQLNNNTQTTYPCSIQAIAGHFLVANTSIRLSAQSGAAIYPYGGTTYLVNNTLVNNAESEEANKAVALRSNKPIVSYGHNVVSKHYDTGTNYSVNDAVNHNDVLDYMLSQNWHTTQHCIYWTKWNVVNEAEVRPAGFVLATPSRVEAAIDAFDSAASTGFKTWLQSLDIDGKGHNALETDILGRLRQAGGASTIWPGSYERSGSYTVE